eukprot:GILK01008645.1.p1 GENE.GILK01008645.1~~GILK01008645.1.p1  ORF type:complete len:1191 (+),score=243.80 GILK01008645.1:44-3574(+)
MEILNVQVLADLRVQNATGTATNKDVGRQLEALRTISQIIAEGKDVSRFLSVIQTAGLNPSAHRTVRVLSYALLRPFLSSPHVDCVSLVTTLNQDLSTEDEEFRLAALRLINGLPSLHAIEMLTTNEQLVQELCGNPSVLVRKCAIESFGTAILRLWPQLIGEDSISKQDIFRDMLSTIMKALDDVDVRVVSSAYAALRAILLEYSSVNSPFRTLSQDFEGNGPDRTMFRPLVQSICRFLFPRMQGLIARLSSLDFKYRLSAIFVHVFLLEQGVRIISENSLEDDSLTVFRLDNNLTADANQLARDIAAQLKVLVESTDPDSVIESGQCLIRLASIQHATMNKMYFSSQASDWISWAIVGFFLVLQREDSSNSVDMLLIQIASVLPLLPPSLQLAPAVRLLSTAHRIQSFVDRIYVAFLCLRVLADLSRQLIRDGGAQTAIFVLFQESWFVELWSLESSEGTYREELLAVMVETVMADAPTLLSDPTQLTPEEVKQRSSWAAIALDIADVCSKVLDWSCGQQANDQPSGFGVAPSSQPAEAKSNLSEGRLYAQEAYFKLLNFLCRLYLQSQQHENTGGESLIGLSESSTMDEKFASRVSQLVTSIVERFHSSEWGSSSIRNEGTKLAALSLISRYWVPREMDGESMIRLVEIIARRLAGNDKREVRLQAWLSEEQTTGALGGGTLRDNVISHGCSLHPRDLREAPILLHCLATIGIRFPFMVPRLTHIIQTLQKLFPMRGEDGFISVVTSAQLVLSRIHSKPEMNRQLLEVQLPPIAELLETSYKMHSPDSTFKSALNAALKLLNYTCPSMRKIDEPLQNQTAESLRRSSSVSLPLHISIALAGGVSSQLNRQGSSIVGQVISNQRLVVSNFKSNTNQGQPVHEGIGFGFVDHTSNQPPHTVVRHLDALERSDDETNWRSKSPVAITGFSDPLYIQAFHVVDSRSCVVLVHFQIVNVTKFEINNIKLRVGSSGRINLVKGEDARTTTIASLSTKDAAGWDVAFHLNGFADNAIHLHILFQGLEDSPQEEDIVLRAIPYSIPFMDLLMSEERMKSFEFSSLWDRLPYPLTTYCMVTQPLNRLRKILGRKPLQEVVAIGCNVPTPTSFHLGYLCQTWFGDQIALAISGRSDVPVRLEIRTSSSSVLETLKHNTEAIISSLSLDALTLVTDPTVLAMIW